ncbi:MAG TPA: phosphoribosyltransferase family protein [Candidatus Sulfotelmatobacter sp.]|nr:phosphoribosyltransferase family protein [Candidatus Sulfotelmatobacter sp.]
MAAVLDLLLPPSCAGCRREGTHLCATCSRPLRRRLAEPPGVPLGLRNRQPSGVVQLEWLAAYTGPTRATLHALKYDGVRSLAEPLGMLLAARWARVGCGGEVLVPVPLHRQRLHDRGYDQAQLLALAAAARLGLPVLPAVRRGEATSAQHALGRGARATNVGHAFVLAPEAAASIEGRWVVVVDDILTTGATVGACASVLRAAGARAVSALVVARDR